MPTLDADLLPGIPSTAPRSATPSTPPPPGVKSSGLAEDLAIGLKTGTANTFLKGAKNVTSYFSPSASASIESKRQEWLKEGEKEPSSFGGRVVRTIGAGLPGAAEFALATIATRGRALPAAIAVGTVNNLDEEPAVAGKNILLDATLGKVANATAGMALPVRMAAGGATAGGLALASGASYEDAAAAGITGAGFAASGTAKKPEQASTRPPQKPRMAEKEFIKIDDRTSVTNTRDMNWVQSKLQSPTKAVQHLDGEAHTQASQVLQNVVMSEARANKRLSTWMQDVKLAYRKHSVPDRSKLTQLLDSETGGVDVYLPENRHLLDSYRTVRATLNEARGQIAETMAMQGRIAPSEVVTWGRENYFPHLFRGRWVIFDSNTNEPITTGFRQKNYKQALAASKEYQKLIPGSRTQIVLDDGFNQMDKFLQRPGDPSLKNVYEKRPRSAGFIQRRQQDLSGWAGGEEALNEYLISASNFAFGGKSRVHMQGAREQIVKQYGEGSVAAKWWETTMDKIEGRQPGWVEQLNANLVKKGYSPRAIERTVGTVAAVEAVAKLGLSPVSAIANSTQFLINAYPILGAKYAIKGMRGAVSNLKTGKYNRLLEELGLLDQNAHTETTMLGDFFEAYRPRNLRDVGDLAATNSKAAAMYLFNSTEKLNRVATAIGAYERALSKGMSEPDAMRMAFQITDRTQFYMGKANTAPLLNNLPAKVLLQFKNYQARQIEFMFSLFSNSPKIAGRFDTRKQELMRFLVGSALAAGTSGIAGIGAANGILKWVYGPDFDLLHTVRNEADKIVGNKDGMYSTENGPIQIDEIVERASRGLPGLLGVDLGLNVGMDDLVKPELRSLMSPAVSDLSNVGTATYEFIQNPGLASDKAWAKAFRGFVPAARRVYDAYLAPASKDGRIETTGGATASAGVTEVEKALLALGVTPIKISKERERNSRAFRLSEQYASKSGRYHRQFAEAIRNKDKAEQQRILRQMRAEGIEPNKGALVTILRGKEIPMGVTIPMSRPNQMRFGGDEDLLQKRYEEFRTEAPPN